MGRISQHDQLISQHLNGELLYQKQYQSMITPLPGRDASGHYLSMMTLSLCIEKLAGRGGGGGAGGGGGRGAVSNDDEIMALHQRGLKL